MQASVESLCNLLAKNRLLPGEQIRTLRTRWRAEGGAQVDDVAAFRAWMRSQGALSTFQLEMLDRGFADFLRFGEYVLVERIGTGRMAGVYKANHPLGQVVAIKVLPPSKAKQPQILGRFQREARLAVRLDHDNVVRTFQHGKTKEGMHFIIMEYLDGETLDEVLARRGPLKSAETIHVLGQALRGLEHLDEAGVVHRDLKPGNLMLVRLPGRPADAILARAVKILDIGLGRALFDEGSPGEGAGDLTGEGALLGTLSYMAPEQIRSAHHADIRADLYSLGCAAYEMLTGQPPFTESNFVKLMRLHAEEKPRPLREAVPDVPEPLAALIDRLLQKDPALRPATPAQALKELQSLEMPVAEPVLAPRPLATFLAWVKEHSGEEPAVPALPPAPTSPLASPAAPLAGAEAATAPAVPQAAAAAGNHPSAAEAGEIDVVAALRRFGWGKKDWIAVGVGLGAAAALLALYGLVRLAVG